MATAEKVANYTDEQTAELKAAYVAIADQSQETRDALVKAFAEKFGKTARSIVAKLTREKVYVAKAYKTKNGETPVKKDAYAEAIGKVLNLTEPEITNLEKANKGTLEKIFKALANSKPIEPGDGNGE